MTRNLTAGRRFAHALLLLAALIQFGAAVIGPSAHLAAVDRSAGSGWQWSEPARSGRLALHHEGDCAVCHTLAAAVFLPRPAAAPLALRLADAGLLDPPRPSPSPFVAFPSARSPPHA